jgi:hypothetical protein
MWLKRGASLLIVFLASITVLAVMAAAGLIHCHDLDHSHHGLQPDSCCTDKILTLTGNTPLAISDNQSFFHQLHLILPRYLFVAEIFQPPRL